MEFCQNDVVGFLRDFHALIDFCCHWGYSFEGVYDVVRTFLLGVQGCSVGFLEVC